MKLNQERLWCLKQFASGGWTIGRGNWEGVKKWEAHKAALVKANLLQRDEYGMFRITEAGKAAIAAEPTE